MSDIASGNILDLKLIWNWLNKLNQSPKKQNYHFWKYWVYTCLMNPKCEFYYSGQSKYPEWKLYQSRQLFLNLFDCQSHFGQVWEHFLWIDNQHVKFIVSDPAR